MEERPPSGQEIFSIDHLHWIDRAPLRFIIRKTATAKELVACFKYLILFDLRSCYA